MSAWRQDSRWRTASFILRPAVAPLVRPSTTCLLTACLSLSPHHRERPRLPQSTISEAIDISNRLLSHRLSLATSPCPLRRRRLFNVSWSGFTAATIFRSLLSKVPARRMKTPTFSRPRRSNDHMTSPLSHSWLTSQITC